MQMDDTQASSFSLKILSTYDLVMEVAAFRPLQLVAYQQVKVINICIDYKAPIQAHRFAGVGIAPSALADSLEAREYVVPPVVQQ